MSSIAPNEHSASRAHASDLKATTTQNLYALLAPITVPPTSPRAIFTNWGLAFRCRPLSVFEPETENQCRTVIELARREGVTLRAGAVGHSPSDLACTGGFMIRTDKMNKLLHVDEANGLVTVQPGMTLNALHEHLASHDLALPSVGSISDQSVGGVVVTSTHGSGLHPTAPSNISLSVRSLIIILSSGVQVTCSRDPKEDPDLFLATLCGLGTTGFITQVTFKCEKRFKLKEIAFNMPFDNFVDDFENIATSAEHVRCWYFGQRGVVRVSQCNRTSEPYKAAGSWFRNVFLTYHVVQFMLYIGRFWPQVNTWTARFASWVMKEHTEGVDDSWKIFNVDCRYPQHTTEFALPLSNTPAALRDLRTWFEKEMADPNGIRPHFPFEVRFSEADDVWLSPANGRRTCWVGVAQYKPYSLPVPFQTLFAHFERIMIAHGGRPHWAKFHPFGPNELKETYPMWDKFLDVRKRVDEEGLWVNEYIRRCFGVEGIGAEGAEKGDERNKWRYGEIM
ncbi:hypothetical protein M422DRAFT_233443 [Sphaerobolus stellatus SS14]|uniref:D-arabinono-1,4-lactone oxidase n=1 Tax=Sphaerobolus stellatus (strain SS14) TaxID=990650 RepID=A0A0C9VAN2_SPHS4|nr:hypothetical protein M422DRAFT_233443 [Sphaerobolus stellatus SS14]